MHLQAGDGRRSGSKGTLGYDNCLPRQYFDGQEGEKEDGWLAPSTSFSIVGWTGIFMNLVELAKHGVADDHYVELVTHHHGLRQEEQDCAVARQDGFEGEGDESHELSNHDFGEPLVWQCAACCTWHESAP